MATDEKVISDLRCSCRFDRLVAFGRLSLASVASLNGFASVTSPASVASIAMFDSVAKLAVITSLVASRSSHSLLELHDGEHGEERPSETPGIERVAAQVAELAVCEVLLEDQTIGDEAPLQVQGFLPQ